jgi:hypothetical protein
LDPSGKVLDVITESTAAGLDFPQGNAVHSLLVAPNGTLSEPNAAVTFSTSLVPGSARILGVAIVSNGNDDGPGKVPGLFNSNGGDAGPDNLLGLFSDALI